MNTFVTHAPHHTTHNRRTRDEWQNSRTSWLFLHRPHTHTRDAQTRTTHLCLQQQQPPPLYRMDLQFHVTGRRLLLLVRVHHRQTSHRGQETRATTHLRGGWNGVVGSSREIWRARHSSSGRASVAAGWETGACAYGDGCTRLEHVDFSATDRLSVEVHLARSGRVCVYGMGWDWVKGEVRGLGKRGAWGGEGMGGVTMGGVIALRFPRWT